MRYGGRIVFCLVGVIGLIGASALASPARAEGPSAAHADNRWYFAASGGVYLREDQSGSTTITNGITTAPGTQNESFDPGPIANVSVGYKIPSHFRIEGEFGFATYKPNQVSPVSSGFPGLTGQSFKLKSGGITDRYTATVNAFYDFHVRGHFVPHLGAGVGGAYNHDTQATFQDASGNTFVQFAPGDGWNTDGIALLEAGLNITASDKWSIVPAYRYLRFFAASNHFGDEGGHIFKIGLRYSF